MMRVVEILNAPVHKHVILNEKRQAGRRDGEIDVIGFLDRQANPADNHERRCEPVRHNDDVLHV